MRNSLDLHRFGGVLYYTVLNQHAHERSKTNVGAARAAGAGGAASEGRLSMGATAAAGTGEHHLAEPVPQRSRRFRLPASVQPVTRQSSGHTTGLAAGLCSSEVGRGRRRGRRC